MGILLVRRILDSLVVELFDWRYIGWDCIYPADRLNTEVESIYRALSGDELMSFVQKMCTIFK